MIDKKNMFRIYSLKTWKQARFQIFLSIAAIAIAVAILTSIKLILTLNDSYTTINAKAINDGDINIGLPDSIITDEQLNLLNKLTIEGKIQYTTTYKIQNNFTNNQITNAVVVKFIDYKYAYISKRIASYLKDLGNQKVLINKAAAEKFQLKKGDTISLPLRGLSNSSSKFIVEDIVENTNVLDESILGVIILDKSDLQVNEDIKKENLATNINIIINKNSNLKDVKSELEKVFRSGANIITYEEGLQANKNIADKESKASGFIQMLVVIMTGMGISITILLLILRRKKDYVLLTIYGMKGSMLRDLILYETYVISVIGIIIGSFLSFIITGLIEKNILIEMDAFTIIKVSILPFVTTILFILVQTMIFTILPITISKEIKPNSILRQETEKLTFNDEYSNSIFKMILMTIICFSLYIRSLKIGLMYIVIMSISIMILYGLSIGCIYLIVKIKATRSKFLLLSLRNIYRQKNRFSFCSTSLIITLILCGLILNLSQSLLPSIIKGISDDTGYNLCVNTNFNEKDQKITEEILNKEQFIKKYIKTINTTGSFKSIQEKGMEEFIKDKKFDKEYEKTIQDFFNGNISIQALDISKEMLRYDTISGRWFSSKDINKNYVVLGERFSHLGININDEIILNIQGQTYKFIVLGICTRSNFRDNSSIYIDINTFKNNTSIGNNNSKIKYLIQNDEKYQKELYLNLTKKLKNSLVLDERDRFKQVNKYIQKLTYVFIYICFISILSALCLIGNILTLINFERLREFLILNVVGAKNKDIRKITIIEGIIVGGISGIVGSLISEFLSYIVVSVGFSCKYIANLKVDLIMIAVSVILTIAASLITINTIKVDKHIGLLRAD